MASRVLPMRTRTTDLGFEVKKLVRFISFSRKMIAQRNNITVTVRTVEKNHYFNVMIQYDELRKLV